MKDDFKRTLKRQIKEEVRSWVEAQPENAKGRHRQLKRSLRRLKDEIKSRVLDDSEDTRSEFEIYKESQARSYVKHKRGIWGHFTSFVSVNAFLIILNFILTPSFPWSLFPLCGWGIGFLSDWAKLITQKKNYHELEKMDSLDDEDLETVKDWQSSRSGLWMHFWSNLAVIGFLFMVWWVAGKGFMWPALIAGALAIGFFGHLGNFFSKRGEFRVLLRRLKKGEKKEKTPSFSSQTFPAVKKAMALRDSILSQLAAGANPFGEDLTLTLDNYVKQVSELARIEAEISDVLSQYGLETLEKKQEELQQKLERSDSEILKSEYIKSLTELEKQKNSYIDLEQQKELLNLKVESAVGNLQKMQLDLARIKSLSDGNREGYFQSLKSKSEELSQYVEDYRQNL